MRSTHTKEEHVKEDVKELLKRFGVWYFMPIGGAFTSVGIPDFVGCFNGRFIAIETKFGRNKLSAWQERVIGLIQNAGGIALVIYETNLSELHDTLTRLQGEHDAGSTT